MCRKKPDEKFGLTLCYRQGDTCNTSCNVYVGEVSLICPTYLKINIKIIIIINDRIIIVRYWVMLNDIIIEGAALSINRLCIYHRYVDDTFHISKKNFPKNSSKLINTSQIISDSWLKWKVFIMYCHSKIVCLKRILM